MGKRGPEKKYTKRFAFSTTKEMKEKIEEMARYYGVTPSDIIRDALEFRVAIDSGKSVLKKSINKDEQCQS